MRRAILLNHGEAQAIGGLAAALAERLTGLPPILEPMLDSCLDLEAPTPVLRPLARRFAPSSPKRLAPRLGERRARSDPTVGLATAVR